MTIINQQSLGAAYEMPRLLSIKQACSILGLGRSSVYALMAARPGQGVCLQTAFLNEVRPDRRNVRLGIAKRVRRRMDREVP
jgi:hypothetical protein